MKGYIVDEISISDMDKIDRFLKENATESEMEGLFWVEIPKDYINEVQTAHAECRPHNFAIELGTDWIKAEFFIRGSSRLTCQCNGYCDHRQREFILNFMEDMIKELNIRF